MMLDSLWLSNLLGVRQDPDEVPGDGAVGVRVVEGRRPARVAHAARPPDPVHVLVGALRGRLLDSRGTNGNIQCVMC